MVTSQLNSKMSENAGKPNPETVTSETKKCKHNSKRRRSKKNKAALPVEDDCSNKQMDGLVDFLCRTITKNESETSVEIDPPVKMAKESPTTAEAGTAQNHVRNLKFNGADLPSTSMGTPDLNHLFQNLQVHTSKNPIKTNNIAEFLNIGLLKKSNCESLSLKDLERLKNEQVKKRDVNEEKPDIPSEKLKEYFNLNLIRQCPEKSIISQIGSSSVHLVSELEQSLHSASPGNKEITKKNNPLSEYFNVDALMKPENNLMTSIKSTSKLLVSELEEKLLKAHHQEKKLQKKKSKKKKTPSESPENVTFDGCQKVFVNSAFHQKRESNESKSSQNKTKKRQLSSSDKDDVKFPKYLTPPELQELSKLGLLMTGIIRINQRNYKEAYITAPDKGMDILIEGLKDRNRALEGDEVYYVLKPEAQYRTTGDSADTQRTAVVVKIKTFNHNRKAIGTFNVIKNKNVNFALFSPRDSRLPRLRIRKSKWPVGFAEKSEDFATRLYCAQILQWTDLRFAEGEIVEEIGLVGEIEAETRAILLKFDLDVSRYDEEILESLPPSTFVITEDELKKREDFRKDCIFTIDPATAVDLDDAVSMKKLPNGNYEVGVHISDVSYFLSEGTPLDKAVSMRATTVYLVQEAYHMLPFELCQLCSLTAGKDKLAFSVLWEVNPSFEIVNRRFTRSVINSCAKFSYSQVQSVIRDPEARDHPFPEIYGGHTTEEIQEIILFLYRMSLVLKSKRFGRGALRIDQVKIRFSLDENRFPVNFHKEIREESNELIEEFMLLANITVAEALVARFPKISLLRQHSEPTPYVLDKLKRSLEKYGIILDVSSSGSLYASLLKYSGDDLESVARILVLNNIVAKPMVRAAYYCTGNYTDESLRWHYALNIPFYTHFTSPIRRYADVMVHRLLAALINYCEPPNWTTEHVGKIVENCNKQKYSSKLAGEASTELFLSVYIGLKGPSLFEAVVCDVKDKSFDCIVLSTGTHQRLYFEHIKAPHSVVKCGGTYSLSVHWESDETHSKGTVQIIELFSIVNVELKRVVNSLKIEATLLRRE